MLTIKSQLLYMLERVADALGEDLRQQLVFVGGCTTALFITDEITFDDIRVTDDVDLIVNLAGYSNWTQMQELLLRRGFSFSPFDSVICRMRLGDLKVDFMPDDERIIGFSNRWYALGIKTAVTHNLARGLQIKHLSPPVFIATKLEAFLGRGEGDLLLSRDAEDILLVLDGREEIVQEILDSEKAVCQFVAEQFRRLQESPDYESFLYGNIRGPGGRVDIVRDRFEKIASADRAEPQ